MSRLKLAATAAALLGGLTMASGAGATVYLDLASTGQIYGFNSTTGAITAVGGVGASLVGLGQLGTTVYGLSGTQLYSISSAGVQSPIGAAATGVSFIDFGSTGGGLYAIGLSGGEDYLYSIDRTTGADHQVGQLLVSGNPITGLASITGRANTTAFGMSTGDGPLLFADGATIYSIDTSSGAATVAGTFSGPGTQFGALMYVGATVEGGSNHNGHGSHTSLYGFTPPSWVTSGNGVETTPNNSKITQFWGLAPGFGTKVVPEPATWALMLAGIGVVGGALRGRRRKATAQA